MDIRSNEPFWLIKNSLGKSYPSLQENLDFPIIILGGGITAALIAYRLVREKKNVVILERRDVFNGSTAASTAMLQYEVDVPLHELIDQIGLTKAVSSYKACEKAIFDLEKIVKEIKSDCEFERKNSIYFTTNKKDLQFITDEFNARKKHGFEVSLLSKEDLVALGIKKGLLGIKSKSGAIMDPYELAKDLLNYSSKKGLTIYDRTSVVKIKHHKDFIELITEDGYVVKTKQLIHCTGYESIETLKKDVVTLKSTFALASEALPKLPKSFRENIFWNTDAPYLYFRSTKDNRIIMGGGDVDFKNAKRRDAYLPKKEKALVKAFKKTFPDIPFTLDYSWAGTFGETKDGLPYMGKPDPEKNEHYILGFGGNGITFSAMGMDAIIASLNNEPHEYLEYYKFKR